MSAKHEEQHQQLLSAMGQLVETSTNLIAKLALRPAVNGVLEVVTDVITAAGQLERSYSVAVGSIVISNPGGNPLTVVAGSPGTTAPTKGRGVWIVPPGAVSSCPIAQHAFTIYGTANDVISLQVFTGLQAYGIGA